MQDARAAELDERLGAIAKTQKELAQEAQAIEKELEKIQATCTHRHPDGTLALVFYMYGGWKVAYYKCSRCRGHDWPGAEQGYEDFFSNEIRQEASRIIPRP